MSVYDWHDPWKLLALQPAARPVTPTRPSHVDKALLDRILVLGRRVGAPAMQRRMEELGYAPRFNAIPKDEHERVISLLEVYFA